MEEALAAAKGLVESDPKRAVAELRKLVLDTPGSDAEATRVKEQAIGALGDALVKAGDAQGLADLLGQLREFFGAIPKAKTAKIVRGIIDQVAKIPGSTQLQVRRGAGRARMREAPRCARAPAGLGASAGADCPPPPPPPRRAPAQVKVCKEQAEWARAEKRTFLRQRIELRLAALHLAEADYPTALSLLGT